MKGQVTLTATDKHGESVSIGPFDGEFTHDEPPRSAQWWADLADDVKVLGGAKFVGEYLGPLEIFHAHSRGYWRERRRRRTLRRLKHGHR